MGTIIGRVPGRTATAVKCGLTADGEESVVQTIGRIRIRCPKNTGQLHPMSIPATHPLSKPQFQHMLPLYKELLILMLPLYK